MEVPLKPDKHMFYKPTRVKETQSESAMMTKSHGICKDGRYCVRLRVPIALRVMSTAVSTCKCEDHIQVQHLKHTMWLPRKEGICHRSRWENTVNDHRRDIHLRVHVTRSKRMCLSNTLEDHRSETHNWSSAQTQSLLSVNFLGTTQRSVQHQQDIHSVHTTAHAVTRRVHVASFHAFLFLLLPVSSSCFCFPNPLCLVFMLQKVRGSISGSKLGFHVFWGSWKTMISSVSVPETIRQKISFQKNV